MKKIIISFAILVISLFLGIFLLSSQGAIAADTCADNCEVEAGHCGFVGSGGEACICPSSYNDKVHQE